MGGALREVFRPPRPFSSVFRMKPYFIRRGREQEECYMMEHDITSTTG